MSAEKIFSKMCLAFGVPEPVTEHRFHPARKWRMDYAWPACKVALEVEGGLFIGGRHNRPVGMQKDFEKYNAAACLGWRVLRCTPRTLCTSATLETIKEAIAEA